MRVFLPCLQFVLLGALFSACASQATLTGGPKDETPPEMVSCKPSANSTQYEGNKVELAFNEFFTLNSPNDSIRINPPLSKKPTYNIKGKKLQILFKEPLQPGTTYCITLDGAIRDITEGNRMPAQSVVFSTGEQLDSLQLQGYAYDAFTRKPASKAVVVLYSQPNDSNPQKNAASYFTLTDRNGFFSFPHLPDQSYQVFAIEDHNNNRRYDLPDEKIAFLPQNAPVRPTADTLALFLFKEREPQTRVMYTGSFAQGGHLLVFSQAVDTFALTDMESRILPYAAFWNNEWDSVRIYFTDTTLQSKESYLLHLDGTIADTLTLTPYAASGTEAAIPIAFKANAPDKVEKDSLFRITFNYPLQWADTNAFTLIQTGKNDTDTVHSVPVRCHRNSLQLLVPLQTKRNYLLTATDSSCRLYNGQYNDSLHFSFSMKGEKEYGRLLFRLQFPQKADYLLQLTDAKTDRPLYSRYISKEDLPDNLQKEADFPSLKEHTYRLRVILDSNANGKWDAGQYRQHLQAEAVFYSSRQWESKKQWTIEETIEIKFE